MFFLFSFLRRLCQVPCIPKALMSDVVDGVESFELNICTRWYCSLATPRNVQVVISLEYGPCISMTLVGTGLPIARLVDPHTHLLTPLGWAWLFLRSRVKSRPARVAEKHDILASVGVIDSCLMVCSLLADISRFVRSWVGAAHLCVIQCMCPGSVLQPQLSPSCETSEYGRLGI